MIYWTSSRILIVTLLLVSSVVTGGCSFFQSVQPQTQSTQPQTPDPVLPATASQTPPAGIRTVPDAAPGPDWVRAVAERVRPAVVQITNEQLAIDQFNQVVPAPVGAGSGIVFDAKNGYILTNRHVVAGAQQLIVALADGRTFPGKTLGSDRDTDLAVVQISAENLPSAILGDSTKLEVGDAVVAIGNALALSGGPTVTSGVVSALARAVQEPPDRSGQPGPYLYGLIQTDAPINPGNSGGPLINTRGEVIGINTLMAALAEAGVQAQGIGFAIAIDAAKPIAQQLITTGRAVHPYLGIAYIPLNPSIADRIRLSAKQGVLVTRVIPDSPAAKAGLREGDIITSIDGRQLVTESTLGEITSERKPGDTVKLDIVRDGQQFSVDVTLGEKPAA